MSGRIDHFSELWTRPEWVLVRVKTLEGVSTQAYTIYNQRTHELKLIRDDAVHEQVCDTMLAHKVTVLDTLPERDLSLDDLNIA